MSGKGWPSGLDRLRTFITAEYAVLSAIAVASALVFVFLRLADVAAGGDTHTLDSSVIAWFRAPDDPSQMIGPYAFREAVRDITALGSFSVLTIIVVLTALFLLLTRQAGAALLVVVSVVGGSVLSQWLKAFFDRPRPDYSAIAAEMSASFPSGHAMLSAVTYLTLGALLSRFTEHRRLRTFYLTAAIVLTLLVGVSRVVLGVHYPSDVIAGWALGAAWAVLCSTIAYVLSRRSAALPPGDA